MGLFDTLRGRREPPRPPGQARSEDELALERYRYLLRTAPPDEIERAHEEAFSRLTPDQRRLLLAELAAQLPPGERAASDDPRALARMATRAEMRQPGTIERALGGVPMPGGGVGFGGVLAGTLLGGLVGSFLGTAIAEQVFDEPPPDEAGYDAAADPDAGGYEGGHALDQGAGFGEAEEMSADLDAGGDMV